MAENALLERMLVAADPARTPREATPDAAALSVRDRIMRTPPRTARVPRATARWAAAGIAAAAAAAVIAVAVILPQSDAEAGMPQPLTFAGGETTAQIIRDARGELAAGDGPAEPARLVRSVTWAFNIDMDSGESEVVPQLSTLAWAPDLSGTVTIIAGEPYDPADAQANIHAEVSSTGEVVTELEMAPGEFVTPVAESFGSTREDLTTALQALGMPEHPTAFEVVGAVDSLMQQWTLTNAQQDAVLSILGEAEGAQPLGASVDRLGRPVSGLRVQSADGAAADVLLISAETGRIVGVERTSLKDEWPIAAGSIISYRLWDVEGHVK